MHENSAKSLQNFQHKLTPADLAMFAKFRIPLELLIRAQVYRVTDAEGREKIGCGRRYADVSGIIFEYIDPETKNTVSRALRRDNPEIEDGKPVRKYLNCPGGVRHLYIPPIPEEYFSDKTIPVVLVEAQKSALAFTALSERTGRKIIAVGVGGCWGWRGRISKKETPSVRLADVVGPSHDLRICDGRKVLITLDSDVATNRNVQQGQNALIRALTGAESILICTVPSEGGEKQGPDDFLAKHTDGEVWQLLDNAAPAVASCDYGGGRFELDCRDVTYIGPPDKEGSCKEQWICSPLHVVAMTRDGKSGQWGRLLEWKDRDDEMHHWAMPVELLQADGIDLRKELVAQGLTISPGKYARELLNAYLQIWPTESRARCVDRLGWYGPTFVLPDEAIGDTDEIVVFQNAHSIEPAFSISGTIEEWRDNVAMPVQGNSRIVFAICVSLAGELLEPAGEDSGGFQYRGPSSTGKTTALKVGASVYGPPRTYCRSWRSTLNGLESLAALHNDGVLILDELGQVDPREAGEAAYLLSNGKGKARASRTGTARQAASWRLLFLSAGEESLPALMAKIGLKATAGQEIRLAEIDIDAGAGMGAFETLNGHDSPASLALALRDAAAKYHGAVGVEWIRHLVADRARLPDEIAKGLKIFIEENAPGADGQVERVARRFGLVALAGEWATRCGLTGWPQGEANKATAKCFDAWKKSFGTVGRREDRDLFSRVKTFLSLMVLPDFRA